MYIICVFYIYHYKQQKNIYEMFNHIFISLILDINIRHNMLSLLLVSRKAECIPYLSSDIVMGSGVVKRGRSGPLHAF